MNLPEKNSILFFLVRKRCICGVIEFLIIVQIDADKGGYINYYELILKHDLLSDHGLIVADNGKIYYEPT